MKFNTVYSNYIKKFFIEKEEEDEDKEKSEDSKDSDVEKAPDNTGNEVIDKKTIDLIIGEVEIYLIDTKEKFKLFIKYLDDSKISGSVNYDTNEDAERAYKGLNTVGELLNYINLHAETDSNISPLLNLLKREIISIKRDYDETEIADLALEFPI